MLRKNSRMLRTFKSPLTPDSIADSTLAFQIGVILNFPLRAQEAAIAERTWREHIGEAFFFSHGQVVGSQRDREKTVHLECGR